jgi:hypothetical protein
MNDAAPSQKKYAPSLHGSATDERSYSVLKATVAHDFPVGPFHFSNTPRKYLFLRMLPFFFYCIYYCRFSDPVISLTILFITLVILLF